MGSLLGITLFGHVGSPIFPWICQQGTVNGAIDSFDKAKTRKSCIFGSKSVLITWAPKTTLSLNLASRHRQTQRTYAHFGVKPWSHRNFLCILLELKPGTMKSQAEKTWTRHQSVEIFRTLHLLLEMFCPHFSKTTGGWHPRHLGKSGPGRFLVSTFDIPGLRSTRPNKLPGVVYALD